MSPSPPFRLLFLWFNHKCIVFRFFWTSTTCRCYLPILQINNSIFWLNGSILLFRFVFFNINGHIFYLSKCRTTFVSENRGTVDLKRFWKVDAKNRRRTPTHNVSGWPERWKPIEGEQSDLTLVVWIKETNKQIIHKILYAKKGR